MQQFANSQVVLQFAVVIFHPSKEDAECFYTGTIQCFSKEGLLKIASFLKHNPVNRLAV